MTKQKTTVFDAADFVLYITTDNDAFADGNQEAEVCRILRAIADRIETEPSSAGSGLYQTVRDINGNDVGRFRMKPTTESR